MKIHMPKSQALIFIYAFLLVFAIFAIKTYLSSFVLLPLVLCGLLYVLIQKKSDYWHVYGVILVLMIGNVIVGYLYAIVISIYHILNLIAKRDFKTDKPGFIIFTVFCTGCVSYLFGQFVDSNLLAFPFYALTSFSLLGVYFFLRNLTITKKEKEIFYDFCLFLVIAQVSLAYITYIQGAGLINVLTFKKTPDGVVGSLGNANNYGLFMFIGVGLAIIRYKQTKFFIYLALIPVLFLFGILADAKSYLIGILLASFFITLRSYWSGSSILKRSSFLLVLSLTLIFVIPPVLIKLKPVGELLTKMYIDGEYNHKYIYMKRALEIDNRNGFQYFIGTGPGTCGSRSANSRAFDSMYKNEDSFTLSFLPAKTSVYAKDLLVDLYQYDYASKSKFRSALLGNPFNSWTSFYIEFGLIGFFMMIYFFFSMAKSLLKVNTTESLMVFVILTSIVIVGWTDQVLERPIPMIFLYLFSGIILQKKNEH